MVVTSRLRSASATIAALLSAGGASAAPPPQIAIVEADAQTATFVGEGTYQVSLRQVARRFYEEHPDEFDTLVVFPAFSTTVAEGALYEPIANDVIGINADLDGLNPETFDLSVGDEYGSERLEGMVQFGDLAQLPGSPDAPMLGRWSVLDLLAQEVAHRHGAFVRFSDDGVASDALLGSDGVHWSFFVDSGGSPLGGNGWRSSPSGGWQTVAPTERYSPLDLYLMGVLPAAEVGEIRVLTDPVVTTQSLDLSGRPFGRDSVPSPGVVVQGSWLEVSVDQIIAVEGARAPSDAQTDPVRRHAFVALYQAGDGGIEDLRVEQLEALRVAWVGRFAELTVDRARVISRLDGRDDRVRFSRELERHGWRRQDGAWLHDRLWRPWDEDEVVALHGEGKGRLRLQGSEGAWSAGVEVSLPVAVEITSVLAPSDVPPEAVLGVRLDPSPRGPPPRLDGLSIGPADVVAADLPPGGGGGWCGCAQAEDPWLFWAWSRRRG